jgi:hypothetical protein
MLTNPFGLLGSVGVSGNIVDGNVGAGWGSVAVCP